VVMSCAMRGASAGGHQSDKSPGDGCDRVVSRPSPAVNEHAGDRECGVHEHRAQPGRFEGRAVGFDAVHVADSNMDSNVKDSVEFDSDVQV